jgi:tripartite-type tricarboxylate transporter receptor subunit TctC
MRLARRRFFELVAGAVLPAISRPAWALDYPTRPVRIIVGFPPGGPTDIFARLISDWLSNRVPTPPLMRDWVSSVAPRSRARPPNLKDYS